MTSRNGNVFRNTNPLWGIYIGSPLQCTYNAELSWFLCGSLEQALAQIVMFSVIWDTMTLMRHYSNGPSGKPFRIRIKLVAHMGMGLKKLIESLRYMINTFHCSSSDCMVPYDGNHNNACKWNYQSTVISTMSKWRHIRLFVPLEAGTKLASFMQTYISNAFLNEMLCISDSNVKEIWS